MGRGSRKCELSRGSGSERRLGRPPGPGAGAFITSARDAHLNPGDLEDMKAPLRSAPTPPPPREPEGGGKSSTGKKGGRKRNKKGPKKREKKEQGDQGREERRGGEGGRAQGWPDD